MRDGAEAARLAHNQKAVGASPTPASIMGLKGIDGGLNGELSLGMVPPYWAKMINANDNFAITALAA